MNKTNTRTARSDALVLFGHSSPELCDFRWQFSGIYARLEFTHGIESASPKL